ARHVVQLSERHHERQPPQVVPSPGGCRMTTDQIVVTVLGLAAALGVAWFFWFKRTEGVRAAVVSDGYQEVMVLVKGGYTPDTIRVVPGRPVRLLFRREETAACSEQVVLPDFGKSAPLPTGTV